MKIGIIADSHDHVPKIHRAIHLFQEEKVELLVHAGDYISPFVLKELLKGSPEFIGVFGNNDGDRLLLSKTAQGRIHPAPYELSLPDHRLMILHEPYGLEAMIRSGLYDVVIFGHTHQSLLDRQGETLVINPGELGGWLYGRSTVGIYDSQSRKGKIFDL